MQRIEHWVYSTALLWIETEMTLAPSIALEYNTISGVHCPALDAY